MIERDHAIWPADETTVRRPIRDVSDEEWTRLSADAAMLHE
jgi:hypothetical protein